MKLRRQQAGFSLVEVSLALLVAGIGILAVFSLFPQGLESTRGAVEASETSAFAEFVFSTLQVIADEDWTNLANDGAGVGILAADPPGAATKLVSSRALADVAEPDHSDLQAPSVAVKQPGKVKVFHWRSTGSKGLSSDFTWSHFTYKLDIGTLSANPPYKYARLEVWPGDRERQVRSDHDYPGSTVFYREFAKQL